MTRLVRCEGKSNPLSRRVMLALAAAVALLAATPACFAYDGPTLRSGLWQFERTLETDGKPTNRLQTSGLLIDRQMTRCVNPTNALKAQFIKKFMPLGIGTCNIKDSRKTDDGYVFRKICGGAAPVKTEIDVESDSAYTEIHEGKIGKIPTKDTVAARRVGDCRRRG
jgi:hypothetical protein